MLTLAGLIRISVWLRFGSAEGQARHAQGKARGTQSHLEFLYPSTTLPPGAAGLVFLKQNLDREMKSSHPSPRARFHGRRRAAV